ncbi:MAG: aminoglycoside 3'-phosphotransferase [Armatimonadota bacterium]
MQRTLITRPLPDLPHTISSIVNEAVWYDSHCSTDARVWFADGVTPCYLKQAPAGTLQPEATMMQFLHSHLMAPELLGFETENGYDYLLTQAVEGEDGIHPDHLSQPERLAVLFGQSLRRLHELPTSGCPFPNRTAQMMQDIDSLYAPDASQPSPSGDQQILQMPAEDAVESCRHLFQNHSDNVVIHGDYCLPNIIIHNWQFKAYIDVGYGGVGDRHYDLFWGIWTLNYNLHTDRYDQAFKDAYGHELIDPDRIELYRLISGLTG